MNIVSVGPPQNGMSDLRSTEPDLKGDDKSLFAKTLSEKEKSPVRPEKPNGNKKPDWASTKPTQEEKPVAQTKDRREQETENGEVQKKAPRLEIPTKKNQQAREKEIEKFMDSFESEFQIPPTRLVEAVALLNTQDQALTSTEGTADLLVSQLNLDPQEEEKAKEMYMGLLVNLDQIDQKSSMPYVVPVAASLPMQNQIQEKFLSTQEKRSKMLSSLDQMNQKFWMQKPEVPVTAPLSPKTIVAQPDGQAPITMGDLMREQEGLLTQGEDAFPMADLQSPVPQAAPNPADRFALQAKNQQEGLTAQEQALATAALAAGAQQAGKSQISPKALPKESELLKAANVNEASNVDLKNLQMNHQMNSLNAMNLASKSGFDTQSDSDSADYASADQEASTQVLSELSPKDQLRSQKFDQLVAGGTAAGAAVTNAQQKEMNINQVMNQAQYLIKKGGGEMKVKLSPEGLGDLHLKVMLDGGKVNVQMSAETNEAKKALESNLSELKQSLSAHKLSVEHVKVDVVNNVSSDISSQLQKDTTQQQLSQDPRDTRQFWNQFQENFGSRSQKESLNDLPNLRGYGQKRKPLEPIEVETKSRRTDGRGNGLNLVA